MPTKATTLPVPKPDHIRSLRDLAANFVRAIDRTALEYEGVATADLTERVTCLVALHEMETTAAELSKIATADLRQRVNLLRQVERASQDVSYLDRERSNGELKKRITYLRDETAALALTAAELAKVDKASDVSALPDDALETLSEAVVSEFRKRKKAEKAALKAARGQTPRGPTLVPDSDFVEDEDETEAA